MAAVPQVSPAKVSIGLVLLTGSLYVWCSAGLIAYNKVLMAPGMFPYPAALGLLHSGFCSLMAGTLYLVKPSLFTSLTNPDKKVVVDSSLVWTAVMPIALLFSLQIVLSNSAYMYSDVAFLQMLKESNVVLVYLFSILLATEVFKWRQMRLICLILISTFITIKGELRFVFMGFVLQGCSCLIESCKISLQGLLLSSMGRGLDVLSYMLLVMPACAVMFTSVLVVSSHVPSQHVLPMPPLSECYRMKWHLLGNACCALALNVAIMVFIQCSSAVSFVLAGILKDVCIVIVGVIFMGHEIGVLQTSGFTAQVLLILLWSLIKAFPKEFEHSVIEGLLFVITGNRAETLKTGEQSTEKQYGSVGPADAGAGGAVEEPSSVSKV